MPAAPMPASTQAVAPPQPTAMSAAAGAQVTRQTSPNQTAAGAPEPTDSTRKNPVDTTIFFANIPVTRDTGLQPTELRLGLRVADGPFGELTRRGLAGKVHDGRLVVRLPREYPIIPDPVTHQQRTCSYVMDCDSDAVKTLGQNELGEHPNRLELVRFISAHISSKSLARGFDVASDVALNKDGDCSEHAVLLAALARRYGLAARVVFGFAVLRFTNRLPLLVGHAWTEIHDGTRWQLADAALDNSGLERVPGFQGLSYLPVQLLKREDAGFRAKLVTEPGCWQVERAEGQF